MANLPIFSLFRHIVQSRSSCSVVIGNDHKHILGTLTWAQEKDINLQEKVGIAQIFVSSFQRYYLSRCY